jgi:methyl-accepting chemotaxis protein
MIINLKLKPLKLIVQEAQKIAGGDLTDDQAVVVQLKRYAQVKDEIGEFARYFDVMKDSLRSIIASVLQSSDKIARTSHLLSDAARQSGETSEQVALTVDNMAVGTNKQSDHANEILKMMDDTLFQVQIGSTEADKTVNNAVLSTQVANDGRNAINQAAEQVRMTADVVAASSASIQKMEKLSAEIGGIITAITTISGQTNLLALNAAIEAARAGEHGKGFSVVADEIRKLAEQTSHEAKQITGLVKSIQEVTGVTVRNMDESLQAVEHQVDAIRKGGSALEVIVGNVEQTESDARQIKAVFGKLQGYTDEVLESVRQISNIIIDAAAAAQEVSTSTEEQATTVNDIAASVAELDTFAVRLNAEVKRFRV